ncbi:hypothetical protein CV102_24365 [Natronococcus pandeyae]|uniref:Uncharacterized protein n=1 Tax=Natronococcus pandeyae TaxID=2055836 RepID=A0A8J8PYD5_9EURY|nr:hypothetical protein CV102_24365 [Natronococcus pandeyae]
MGGSQIPIGELHEILLEAEQTLRKIGEQLPDPLTLNSSAMEAPPFTSGRMSLAKSRRCIPLSVRVFDVR